jgi:hypothetical protein
VDVRVPVEEFSKRLDGGHHAGHDVIPAQQAANFGLKARPTGKGEPEKDRKRCQEPFCSSAARVEAEDLKKRLSR